MLVNIIENTAIILFAIYIYFKINKSTTHYHSQRFSWNLFNTICVIIVGLILMYFTIPIEVVRFDYRNLLYALAIRYFGWKVTVPSIVVLTLVRLAGAEGPFFWSIILSGVYLSVSMPLLMRWLRSRYTDFVQLFILLTNNLIATSIFSLIWIEDLALSLRVLLIYLVLNYIVLWISYYMIDDLSSMVTMINLDCLTSLNNQRRFNEDLAILDNLDKNKTLSIIDIDYFKTYNDRYGHQVGDIILQKIASVFQEHSSDRVNFYRIGGEEFAMIITGVKTSQAESLVDQVHQKISQTPISDVAPEINNPTVSIGLAHVIPCESMTQAYQRADEALYIAKRNGRNQIHISQ